MQGLRLPALETLLARGTLRPCPADGVEAAVCAALEITRQLDWPIAPITLEADGGVAGDAYWLRADPVHLRLMRDRIVLTDNRALDLSQPEADALATGIAHHFGDTLRLFPLHPKRWYLRIPTKPQLITTPLSVATGRAIDPLLPHGVDAPPYRTLFNEVQMLLHEHPVNQAREMRGALPVNALWLWGGGNRPAVPAARMSLYVRDEEMQALGKFCNAKLEPPPTTPSRPLLGTSGLVVLDALTTAGQNGDAFGWRDAIRELEANWFAPLFGALRAIGPDGTRLLDPVNGKMLLLQRADAWKIWRRARGLATMPT